MRSNFFIFVVVLWGLVSAAAYADNPDRNVDIIPLGPASHQSVTDVNSKTHSDINLTPDRSLLIRLDEEAGSVIVGNPVHLSVLVENTKTLVLVPRAPGATHMTVLGKEGRVLMQRHVTVAGPKAEYVRVRKACAASEDKKCQSSHVYYCPGVCHEIGLADSDSDQDESAPDAAGASAPPGEEGSDAIATEERE